MARSRAMVPTATGAKAAAGYEAWGAWPCGASGPARRAAVPARPSRRGTRPCPAPSSPAAGAGRTARDRRRRTPPPRSPGTAPPASGPSHLGEVLRLEPPALTAVPRLTLPDGDGALQLVDGVSGRLERLSSVRGGNRHH